MRFIYCVEDLPETYSNRNNSFCENFRTKWNLIHDTTDVFRYNISKLRERIVANMYLLQLNPDRGNKRRIADEMKSVSQRYDPRKFNFNKITSHEVIYEIYQKDQNDKHLVVVNVSPISRYHSLLCPFIDACLPQIITRDSLQLVLEIMFIAQNRDMRIGFNSLCGLASVNHLHYHIFLEGYTLPFENKTSKHIKGDLHIFEKQNSAVPAFCFQIKTKHEIHNISNSVYKLIEYLIKNNIAHNLMMSRGNSYDGCKEEVIRIIVWPRIGNCGVKQYAAFNVAICELSGWFPVYDEREFEALTSEDIETELNKWAWPDFDNLCLEVETLY